MFIKLMPISETCFVCKDRILDIESVVCLDCETVFCDNCLPDHKPCPICYCVVGRVV